jgi:hypothetical protein
MSDPLQPTAAERQMDPQVVAASEQEVVVLWWQRGRGPTSGQFNSPVLGLYRVRDGKLARAQMFYFDTVAVAGFWPTPSAIGRHGEDDGSTQAGSTAARNHWRPEPALRLAEASPPAWAGYGGWCSVGGTCLLSCSSAPSTRRGDR